MTVTVQKDCTLKRQAKSERHSIERNPHDPEHNLVEYNLKAVVIEEGIL